MEPHIIWETWLSIPGFDWSMAMAWLIACGLLASDAIIGSLVCCDVGGVDISTDDGRGDQHANLLGKHRHGALHELRVGHHLLHRRIRQNRLDMYVLERRRAAHNLPLHSPEGSKAPAERGGCSPC